MQNFFPFLKEQASHLNASFYASHDLFLDLKKQFQCLNLSSGREQK